MANTLMYGGSPGYTIVGTNTLNAGVARGRFIKSDFTGYADVSDDSAGVSLFAALDDEGVVCQVSNVVLVEAGAAIAAKFNQLATDNVGRVIDYSSGTVRGKNLDTASAAGDFIRVLLNPVG